MVKAVVSDRKVADPRSWLYKLRDAGALTVKFEIYKEYDCVDFAC